MKKQNFLLVAVGLLLGFVGGFVFANTANQRGYAREAAAPNQPHEHEHASERPADFDAQVRAAELAYSAHR